MVTIDALDVLCAQLTRDLFAIAKFLYFFLHSVETLTINNEVSNSINDDGDVMLQGYVMQQQSRRRLPSLHAIGRSRCVDLDETPSEPAWIAPSEQAWIAPRRSEHDVDKIDDDDEDRPRSTRYDCQHSTYWSHCS